MKALPSIARRIATRPALPCSCCPTCGWGSCGGSCCLRARTCWWEFSSAGQCEIVKVELMCQARILEARKTDKQLLAVLLNLWILNPIVINVSTRGNAEAL
eukprot:706592-Hanusia_phi.AAC.1